MTNNLDTKVIGKLAEILDKNNLTEIEFENEGCRILLSRNNQNTCAPIYQPVTQAVPTTTTLPLTGSVPAATIVEAVDASNEDYTNNPNAIKSPMVGVIYLAADPNSPDYVKIGNSIKEGDIVCLIEAMKTFNPVKAHKSGKVTKILAEAGDPVEYGQPLVVIE